MNLVILKLFVLTITFAVILAAFVVILIFSIITNYTLLLEPFKRHNFLIDWTLAMAIIASFYLFLDIYDDIENGVILDLKEKLITNKPISSEPIQNEPRIGGAFPSSKILQIFRDSLKDGGWGPEMVWIPAGTFQMGDLQGSGADEELPVHQVSVKRFAMGRYEVTVDEFRQFVNATGYKTDAEKRGWCYTWLSESSNKNWYNLGFTQAGNHPVACVSWNDAGAYVHWLSQQTGQNYRLPTEAEWEYAARAGVQMARYWGNDPADACSHANVGDRTTQKKLGETWLDHDCQDGNVYTAVVGSFVANAYGLFDMLGNVWEWTCSEYDNRYQGKEQHCLSKNCANDDSLFVRRGGSWDFGAWEVRSANRNWGKSTERSISTGLRLVR